MVRLSDILSPGVNLRSLTVVVAVAALCICSYSSGPTLYPSARQHTLIRLFPSFRHHISPSWLLLYLLITTSCSNSSLIFISTLAVLFVLRVFIQELRPKPNIVGSLLCPSPFAPNSSHLVWLFTLVIPMQGGLCPVSCQRGMSLVF